MAETNQKVEKFLTRIDNDESIIKGMQRIPEGEYNGKLHLINSEPVCEIVPILGTEFKRAFVRMDLTHSESGNKQQNVEVGYNTSLKPILQDEKFWEQKFHAVTSERVSKAKNPYQIVMFAG
jgi:hypothetical protein